MDFHGQKVNLSFSIENILRDDFARHRRRTNFVSFHTAGDEAGFERWPTNPAVYQCCAVRYSPVYLNCAPNMHAVEGRLRKTSGGKDQFFREQTKAIEEDSLSCKGEEIQNKNDEVDDKDFKKESKSVKCFSENGPKRKRRNRSHFTQRQLQYLDKIFSRQQYLTRDERTLLARGLEMTELQIRNWFQNRRYQKRHRANEERKQDEPVTSIAI